MAASTCEYYDLGSYRRTVTAKNKEAREWFNRGLIWSYGFNHGEAVKCFERAVEYDDKCCMAYWGLAYALGPNYNKPWESFDELELQQTLLRAGNAIEQAISAALDAVPVEKELIQALSRRLPRGQADSPSACNQRYAEMMKIVYDRHPDDLDVAALYVDSLMNLTPWKLWDIHNGEPAPGAHTLFAGAILHQSMSQSGGPDHPGLLHLYIHLMEMSTGPEKALKASRSLRKCVPDSGHLNHMPSHIYVLVGDYESAIEANQMAIRSDDIFFQGEDPLQFYTLYRIHNYHFCLYAAMFAAKSRVALETVSELEKALSEELLRVESPPMADWLEGFLAMRVHALIRFGRWQDIIDLPFREDRNLYCVTTAMMHYAKGVALAAIGKVSDATEQRQLFANAVADVPQSRTLFNNNCLDILKVAEAMLDGELEYRRGNNEAAFAHLRAASHKSYVLPFDEPWGWMQPPSHALGALLAEQGHYNEAADIYAEDLGIVGTLPRALQHPNNVWALHGYHECMTRLGNFEEAQAIRPKLEKATAKADIPITSSCFCRLITS